MRHQISGEFLNIEKIFAIYWLRSLIDDYCNNAKLPTLNQCLNGKINDYFIEIEMPGIIFSVASSRMSLYEPIYVCVCLSISKSKINSRHSNWFGNDLRLHNAHNGNHLTLALSFSWETAAIAAAVTVDRSQIWRETVKEYKLRLWTT